LRKYQFGFERRTLKINKEELIKIYHSRFGTGYKIVDYQSDQQVMIEFLDKYKYRKTTTFGNIKNEKVKNPYDVSVWGVGYLGDGDYKAKENHDRTDQYKVWFNMLQRCYSKNKRDMVVYKTYNGICKVSDEWLNFQNFAEWYDGNFYSIGEGMMHLDKDILVPNNKEYSPDTCIFVPQRINMLFTRQNKVSDSDLPNGIFRSHLSNGNIRYRVTYNGKYIGTFDIYEDAVERRKTIRKSHIVKVAKEYRDLIPVKLYEALLSQ